MSTSSARSFQDTVERDRPTPLQQVPDFSLMLGGPLFQLLRKSRLEGDAMEMLHRRILAAIMLTWVPLLVFSTFGPGSGGLGRISFVRDIEVQVRFLVALPILIAAELVVHARIRLVI